MPSGTDVAVFKGNLYTLHPAATFQVYQSDGVTVRVGNVISTDKVKVTAVDGVTTKTYVVTVNA